MTLAKRLLDWYYRSARDLPWRADNDAYKIWVSEIMLQQTRVEAVKKYYTRWIERFPTLEVLAEASEQEVLTYWQGLGYYSRARNLLAGVRKVCAEYGGRMPNDLAAIQSLPGVGDYTAGAIASIAYGRPVPAIDGNVLRIVSRLFCLDGDITKQTTKRQVKDLVRKHMSIEHPGDFNQALMDLGATICIPRQPRCESCPVVKLCEAYAQEVQNMLPVRSEKKEPELVELVSGLVLRDGYYLLNKRPAKGLLAGMWEFPTFKLTTGNADAERLQEGLYREFGQTVCVKEKGFHYLHIFSHRKWDITFYSCEWQAGHVLPESACWLDSSELMSVPWAGPHHKVALTCKNTPNL